MYSPRSIFQSPPSLRYTLFARLSSTTTTNASSTTTNPHSHLPRIAQPSLWASLIPKPLRRNPSSAKDTTKKPHWLKTFWANPVTPVILLSLLVGSQAIQTLTLKNEILAYSRRTEAKIGVLREVIRRVQEGKDVDVEAVLGTGVEKEEVEWEDVIREIEADQTIVSRKKRSEARKLAALEEKQERTQQGDAANTVGRSRKPFFV